MGKKKNLLENNTFTGYAKENYPVKGHIMTSWANKVNPDKPWQEYPRPQLIREKWMNLNGPWDFAILPKNDGLKEFNKWLENNPYPQKLVVPFPIESALSGVKSSLLPNQRIWYHRSFNLPDEWKNTRLKLHFGAVDFECEVWANDIHIGIHKGGNVGFSFELLENVMKSVFSSELKSSPQSASIQTTTSQSRDSHKNRLDLKIAVWDPTDKGLQERGKQMLKPYGIFYNAMSGIWQTVWLEPLPKYNIEQILVNCKNSSIKSDEDKKVYYHNQNNNKKDFPKLEIEIKTNSLNNIGSKNPNVNELDNKMSYIAKIWIVEHDFELMKKIDETDKNMLIKNLSIPHPESEILNSKILLSKEIQINKKVIVDFKNGKYWSPENPQLYDLYIGLYLVKKSNNNDVAPEYELLDYIKSYFGIRNVSLKKDDKDKDILRIALNDKFVFQYGFLDQGWWPDGLYTPPSDEAMLWDIEITKKMGMNLIRKHVKVEPDRWYYHCDRLGMIVWQDMPSGGEYGHKSWIISLMGAFIFKKAWKNGRIKKNVIDQYYFELTEMVNRLRVFPCILVWVPFNESWGQFDTAEVTDYLKKLDHSRLIDSASGWIDYGTGDIHSIHKYPGPECPRKEPNRALALSEFGGLGLICENHIWQADKKNWGYKTMHSKEEFAEKYKDLVNKLSKLIETGLSAAVYTQTTDVEGEVNGLITYDREVIKIPIDKLQIWHSVLNNKNE